MEFHSLILYTIKNNSEQLLIPTYKVDGGFYAILKMNNYKWEHVVLTKKHTPSNYDYLMDLLEQDKLVEEDVNSTELKHHRNIISAFFKGME